MSWIYYEPNPIQTYFEIMPLDDIRDHDTGDECPCNPKVMHNDGSVMVSHNAWDGREETERKPLQNTSDSAYS